MTKLLDNEVPSGHQANLNLERAVDKSTLNKAIKCSDRLLQDESIVLAKGELFISYMH